MCWHQRQWRHDGNTSSSSRKHVTATATAAQGPQEQRRPWQRRPCSHSMMGSNMMLTQRAALRCSMTCSCDGKSPFFFGTSDSLCTTANHICITVTCRHPQRHGSTMGSKHDGGAMGGTATVAIRHTAATTTQRPAVRCSTTGRSAVVAARWVAAQRRGHDLW